MKLEDWEDGLLRELDDCTELDSRVDVGVSVDVGVGVGVEDGVSLVSIEDVTTTTLVGTFPDGMAAFVTLSRVDDSVRSGVDEALNVSLSIVALSWLSPLPCFT